MLMTREYVGKNLQIAIRFRCPDGSYFWEYDNLGNLESHISMMKERGYRFVKYEMCRRQPNQHVRDFLNLVSYNHKHNFIFGSMSWTDVFELALETGLQV